MTIMLCVMPGFRFEIHLCSIPWDRAGRIPLGARLQILGKELFYFDFFLPDKLLYHVAAIRAEAGK